MKRAAFGALAAAAILTAPAAAAPKITAGPEPITVKATPIPHFRIGHGDQTRFGELDYLGGFELWSKNRHFGALSGIVSLDDGTRIIAVTDNGFWFDARIDEDADGRPVAVRSARLAPMLDATGKSIAAGHNADAEALAFDSRSSRPRFLVGFERNHRIVSYPADTDGFRGRPKRFRTPGAVRRLRFNRGLEAVAIPPAACPLPGAVVAIAERDRDRNADIPGWIIGGPKPGRFRIRLRGDFSVTDAAFLPSGDLVILERKFNFAEGVAMRLRRIRCSALRPGARIDGVEMMTADFGYQIDNMEGLSVHTDRRGKVVLTLTSDDNRSILQRTLLLRFRLVDPPRPPVKPAIGLRPSSSPPAAAE